MQRKNLWRSSFLFACTLSLAQCTSSPNVKTRLERGVDFERFRTFGVSENANKSRPSWVDAQIQLDIERLLQEKGYEMASIEEADLLVSYHTERRQRRVRQVAGSGSGGASVRSIAFEEGSLILEVRDPRLDRLVFRGVGYEIVDDNKEKTRRKLSRVINEILDPFPAR